MNELITSGHAFQILRAKDRKITVVQACAGIMSESSLRRFEQGKTSPYLVTILPLLDRVRISPSEFFTKESNFQSSNVASFYDAVSQAYNRRDVITLNRLLSKIQETHTTEPIGLPFNRLDQITVRSAIGMIQSTPLSEADSSFAVTYLKSQRNWFFYDLNMLRYIPLFLTKTDLVWLSQNIFSRASAYITVLNNADLVTNIVLNVETALIASAREYDEAEDLLARSHRNNVLQDKLEFSAHRKVLEAALVFHQGDPTTANKMHAQILDALEVLSAGWNIQQVETMWPFLTKTN